VVAGFEHELLDRSTEVFNGASIITCSELTDCAIDIGLAPEQAGAIVEDVEVEGVISLLLDYLELNVLVIQSLVVNGAVGVRKIESGLADSGAAIFFRRALAETWQRVNLDFQHILDMLYSVLPLTRLPRRLPGARLAKEASE